MEFYELRRTEFRRLRYRMAFSASNGGVSSRSGASAAPRAMSEMNVVPLVDVVLVLLMIFMLTAHVMEFGLEIEVPKVKQVQHTTEELPVVSITRRRQPLPQRGRREYQRARRACAGEVRAARRRSTCARTGWRRSKSSPQVADALRKAQLEVRVVTQPDEDTRRSDNGSENGRPSRHSGPAGFASKAVSVFGRVCTGRSVGTLVDLGAFARLPGGAAGVIRTLSAAAR